MYRGFNIEGLSIEEDYGKNYIETSEKVGKQAIEEYIKKTMDGGSIKNSLDVEKWTKASLPEINADIFLSHSHKDIILARRLAGYLNEYLGLKVFIDSFFWDNIADVQKELDELYATSECDCGEKTYEYLKRNKIATHVNIMLTSALTNMIDKTDFFFFLNTSNSTIEKDQTTSAWIHHELMIADVIIKNRLMGMGPQERTYSKALQKAELEELVVHHSARTERFISFSINDLKEMVSCKQREAALDYLYNKR